jgi:hypothetical protein
MEFYQVPINELFPEIPPLILAQSLSFDLVKISNNSDAYAQQLEKFTRLLSDHRKDWNGQCLKIRAYDLKFLSMLLGLTDTATLAYLTETALLTA